MPRNPIQDIVPNGRSIRNIPLPENRRRVAEKLAPRPHHASRDEDPIEEERTPDEDEIRSVRQELETRRMRGERRSGGKRWALASIIAVAVIAFAMIVSNVFHGATITVTPRTAAAAIQASLTAKKAPGAGDLPFALLTLKESGSSPVDANGEEKVNKAASGIIVIYNNYNSSAQRLVKNTRFETPEGLIYRITDSVTVPGKKGSTPGSVEATVVADAAGDKYNVGLKDFTIPGFKGDPRYTTFYARSKTALQGGFVGTVKIVSDADRKKAQDEIQTKATVDLLKQVADRTATSSVFFDKAYAVDCVPLPQETISDKQALIKMDCTLSAALFDRGILSSYLAETNVSGYAGEPIVIDNLSSLAFAPKTDFDPTASSISFSLAGNATFEWVFDEAKLKQDFAGKTKADAPGILQKYPMIEKAETSIRPIWRRVFPASPSDITVEKVI